MGGGDVASRAAACVAFCPRSRRKDLKFLFPPIFRDFAKPVSHNPVERPFFCWWGDNSAPGFDFASQTIYFIYI